MTNEHCGTCIFWNNTHENRGECRRHAPAIRLPAVGEPDYGGLPVWPTVGNYDWCGDWKSNEGK